MNKLVFATIAILLFWAGFVSSISFMEAWLKFRAPGVSLPVGLSIGKTIFSALNRMEWIFLFASVLFVFVSGNLKRRAILFAIIIILLILLIQTFVLLPLLNERANIIIEGETVGKSMLHIYFGVLEISKVFLLVFTTYRIAEIQQIINTSKT
jgi:hypothetical protein